MALESAKEFLGRLDTDSNFRDAFAKAKEEGKHGAFLDESGFKFNDEELDEARLELGLDGVVGGVANAEANAGPICGC